MFGQSRKCCAPLQRISDCGCRKLSHNNWSKQTPIQQRRNLPEQNTQSIPTMGVGPTCVLFFGSLQQSAKCCATFAARNGARIGARNATSSRLFSGESGQMSEMRFVCLCCLVSGAKCSYVNNWKVFLLLLFCFLGGGGGEGTIQISIDLYAKVCVYIYIYMCT